MGATDGRRKGTLKLLDLSRNGIGTPPEDAAEGSEEAHEESLTAIFMALGELERLEQLMLDENGLEWVSFEWSWLPGAVRKYYYLRPVELCQWLALRL